VAEIRDGDRVGRGECVPYPRYEESVDGVCAALEDLGGDIADGLERGDLQERLPAGAARNALDCAFWDLAAKQSGRRVWTQIGRPAPRPQVTAFTISVGSPEKMAADARAAAHRPLLKLKLGGAEDVERVRAVRSAAPESRLVVDANEAWTPADCERLFPRLAELKVEMVEQPLPAGGDEALTDLARPVPVCADESCHDSGDLDRLAGRYDMVNIKLDKTGGLTEALALAEAATARGLQLMIGCMVGTSLAMAPATVLMDDAAVVDLDGPLLLERDRTDGLDFTGDRIHPPAPALWG